MLGNADSAEMEISQGFEMLQIAYKFTAIFLICFEYVDQILPVLDKTS